MYNPVNQGFTTHKWGSRESNLHRRVRPSFLFFVLPIIFLTSKGTSEGEIKIKFIQTIFKLNKNRRKHEIVFPSILIQFENGLNEFYFYFTN